jgi:hypothetical protein
MLNKEIKNFSLSTDNNVISLGKNCLSIRKGVGQAVKKQSKVLNHNFTENKINQKSNLDYSSFF